MKLKIPGRLAEFPVRITVAFLLAGGVSAILILYFNFPEHVKHITFVTVLIGGAATLYLAYYAGITLRTGIERDRQHRSFELLQELNRTDYVTIRVYLEREVQPHTLAPKACLDKISADRELYGKVTRLLNFFEDVSIAIQSGYADEEILFDSLRWMIPFFFKSLCPYIEAERRESGHTNELYIEVEKLAKKWMSNERLTG